MKKLPTLLGGGYLMFVLIGCLIVVVRSLFEIATDQGIQNTTLFSLIAVGFLIFASFLLKPLGHVTGSLLAAFSVYLFSTPSPLLFFVGDPKNDQYIGGLIYFCILLVVFYVIGGLEKCNKK